jgi:protein TonB
MTPAINCPVPTSGFSVARLPAWALGLSLAVHLAILAGPFVQHQAEKIDLPPLVVNFRMPAALAPASTARVSESSPLAAPTPTPAAGSTPRARQPATAVSSVAAAASEVTASATLPPVAERSDVAPQVRTPESSPLGESADPAAMARYIRLLGELLAQQQQYPRQAALRGWEGEVKLRLQVARKGNIVAVHVLHSSGFEVLDQHAVQLVQGATLPPPPAAWFSNAPSTAVSPDFLIDIPIHYALKKQV